MYHSEHSSTIPLPSHLLSIQTQGKKIIKPKFQAKKSRQILSAGVKIKDFEIMKLS